MNRITALAALTVLLLVGAGFSAKIEVFTADNIVQLVKDKVSKTQSFTGSFVYTINGKTSWGAIRFKAPNKFLMIFMDRGSSGGSYETGQKIISDGKILWLVFKNENIAINEPLDKEKKTPMMGWNINRLLKEYVPTLPKSGYQVVFNNKAAFKLVFIPKSNTSGFRNLTITVGENGEIWKVETVSQLGASIEFTVTYSSFNEGIREKDFEYDPDENTQIYENILLPHDEDVTEE